MKQPATQLVDIAMGSPAANLALDESLLEAAETGRKPQSILRLWEPDEYFVVLGQSCRYLDEVRVPYCNDNNIPILRRCSGGGTIVTGPGCLMYSLVIPYDNQMHLRMIDQAHQFALSKMQAALRQISIHADSKGLSDLVVGQLKFSGNAMRCKRHHFLYHGTLLCSFDLELIPNTLKTPPRQPDYRNDRSHDEFVMNLGLKPDDVKRAIIAYWNPEETVDWPKEQTMRLVNEKYSRDDWNFKR